MPRAAFTRALSNARFAEGGWRTRIPTTAVNAVRIAFLVASALLEQEMVREIRFVDSVTPISFEVYTGGHISHGPPAIGTAFDDVLWGDDLLRLALGLYAQAVGQRRRGRDGLRTYCCR